MDIKELEQYVHHLNETTVGNNILIQVLVDIIIASEIISQDDLNKRIQESLDAVKLEIKKRAEKNQRNQLLIKNMIDQGTKVGQA